MFRQIITLIVLSHDPRNHCLLAHLAAAVSRIQNCMRAGHAADLALTGCETTGVVTGLRTHRARIEIAVSLLPRMRMLHDFHIARPERHGRRCTRKLALVSLIHKGIAVRQQRVQILVVFRPLHRYAPRVHRFIVLNLEHTIAQAVCQFRAVGDRQAAIQIQIALKVQFAARGIDRGLARHGIPMCTLQAAGGGHFVCKGHFARR